MLYISLILWKYEFLLYYMVSYDTEIKYITNTSKKLFTITLYSLHRKCNNPTFITTAEHYVKIINKFNNT